MSIPAITISDSVGANATNKEADVKTVRDILKQIATALGDAQYNPGTDNEVLIKAIKAFQRNILLKNAEKTGQFTPDGNISSQGSTWKGLRCSRT